jgi:hypothetical protein
MKLKSASILNNHYNVTDHVATVRFLSIDFPKPISDGNYSGEQYAYYLQQQLNSSDAAENWRVYYNGPALKYFIQFNNMSSNSVELKFNDAMKTFMGFNSNKTFPANQISSFESDEKVKPMAGYYRIVSNSLSSNSMGYDDADSSGVVAVVPINAGYGQFTTYRNEDEMYITTVSEQNLYNFIDLHFYIEDTDIELDPAVFQLNFQFI